MSQVNLSFKLPCHSLTFILFLIFITLPLLLACTLFVDYLSTFWGRQLETLLRPGYVIIEERPPIYFQRDSVLCSDENYYKDIEPYTLPASDSKCDIKTFTCKKLPHEEKAKVIPYTKRCDGVPDCLSGSDEFNCKECQTSFSCPSADKQYSVCVRAAQLCDGIADCPYGEDETLKYCPPTVGYLTNEEHQNYYIKQNSVNCTENEFECQYPSKHCIPKEFVCDGEPHCPSQGIMAEDEMNCEKCNGKSIYCQSPLSIQMKCIAHYRKCDRVVDCLDHSDERTWDCTDEDCAGSCKLNISSGMLETASFMQDGTIQEMYTMGFNIEKHSIKCPDGQVIPFVQACSGFYPHCDSECPYCTAGAFRCKNGTECLLPGRVCDGIPDCEDKSDEGNCEAISKDCNDPFRRCNGYQDCSDNKDEMNCTSCEPDMIVKLQTFPKNSLQAISGQRVIPLPSYIKKSFHCAAENKCLPLYNRCDGHEDCQDGADEMDCTCNECLMHYDRKYICRTGQRCFAWNEVCIGNQTRCPGKDDVDVQYCLKLANGKI